MEPDVKLAEALDKCLARMQEGKSVDVCLAQNEGMHDRVEPLLYTGHFISTLPKVQPDEEFRRTAKGHLMARLHEEESQAERIRAKAKPFISFPDEFSTTMQQLWQTIAGARKAALPVALGLILIIASAVSAINFMSPSPALADGCTLSILSGSVEIQAPAANSQPGTEGMTLDVGSRVKTTQDSTALLTFFDGSTLKVGPGTDIEIQQIESKDKHGVTIVLKQWIGRTWSSVVKMADKGSRYEINTPSAVALVRGTKFVVEVDEAGQTTEQTTQGLVSVAAQGKEVFVPAGQVTTVELGATPAEPVIAPAAEDQSQEQSNQAPANVNANTNIPPDNGQGNGNANGQDKGNSAGGNDQGNANGLDKGNSAGGNDQGNGNANGQDKGNAGGNDQGNGNANGQDKGNANGQDKGNANGQGNGNANGNPGGNANGNPGGNANGNPGGTDPGKGNPDVKVKLK